MKVIIPVSKNYKTIQEWIARHPLAAFIALAFLISWASWLLMWFLNKGANNGLFVIGATAPALAAMIVSAILKPDPSGVTARQHGHWFGVVWFLVLAVLAFRRFHAALGWTNIALKTAALMVYPSWVSALLDILGAGTVAFVLAGTDSPRQGVRNLLRSLNPFCQPTRWYWFVIAIGLYPGIIALGNAISTSMGLARPATPTSGTGIHLALDIIISFFSVLLFGGGLEEPGWRGFALPRLQKRYSPLHSSLILAVIWAFWHWPLFWFGYYGGGPLGVFLFIVGTAPIAILFTTIFNQTGGNLSIAVLLHTSINITPVFLPASALGPYLWILLILAIAVWMWYSPQTIRPSQCKA